MTGLAELSIAVRRRADELEAKADAADAAGRTNSSLVLLFACTELHKVADEAHRLATRPPT